MNCQEWLSFYNFYVPLYKTRLSKTFYLPFQKTNHAEASPINRTMLLANDVQNDLINFFSIKFFNNYANRIYSE